MTEVVILPGLDGTARLLETFCSSLGSLGVPARAVGYPPDQRLGYQELEQVVLAQLPSTPFVLLAESFSGPLAIRIAARRPGGLAGLVLSTTFARSPVAAVPAVLASLVRLAPAHPPMTLLSWWLLGRWATPALRSELAQALRLVAPSVLRARAVAALRADVSALLPSVQVPVLQLVAAHDRLLASSASRTLAAALPRCRTVTVRGPHLLLQASVAHCAHEVAAFALGLGAESSFEPEPLRSPA